MNEIPIYASATIAILGIAYPILLQVISRLDEKYDSDHIVELFEKEWIRKLFIGSLIASLISVFLWSLNRPPLFLSDYYVVKNSAAMLVIASTTLLVIVFFRFVDKVIVYYTPQKIAKYFMKKHETSIEELKYFKAIANIFLVSIKRHQTNISKTLSLFFYGEFMRIREEFKNQPVEYPQQFYDLVYESVEELALQKEKRNRTMEHNIGGGIWLIGQLEESQISERTYIWLWQNLRLAVRYNHDDMVFDHWENADQYYSFDLPHIEPVYDLSNSSHSTEQLNKDEMDQRVSEREKFIEFHYALGGLLTFSKWFDCMRRMFEHTNHTPPKYELLPDSMDDIFGFFFKFRNDFNREYAWISTKYPFPSLSGLNADGVIKRWISSYMAILFLRQFTLHPYFTYMHPIKYPRSPTAQGEKKRWIEGLEFFKELVVGHLKNEEMLKSLDFDFITEEWCEEKGRPHPIAFIDELKRRLEEQYNVGSLTLLIDPEKEQQFFDSSKRIIEPAIESAFRINNAYAIMGETDKRYVIGERMLQRKDPFSANPEASHANFDSILAEVITRKINDGVSSTFLLKSSNRYLIIPDSLFKAIDALKINKEDFVILNFGLRIGYYADFHNVKDLTEGSYKGIPIIYFTGGRHVNRSLFVLKREDFPRLTMLSKHSEVESKYKLKPISDQFNVFGSVLDLNREAEIREEFRGKEKTVEELKKSVLVSIYLYLEIKWKKEVKVIEIKEHSPREEQGIGDELKDVTHFN